MHRIRLTVACDLERRGGRGGEYLPVDRVPFLARDLRRLTDPEANKCE